MKFVIKKNSFLNKKIYIFLLGTIGFSMLGQHFVLNVLGMPFFFIEWMYVPLIYIYGKKAIKNAVKHLNVYSLLMVLLLLLGCCIGIVSSGTLSFLDEYRNIVYLFIVFQYIKHCGIDTDLATVVYVCFCAVFWELVYIAFISSNEIVSSMNCVAIAVAIIGSFVCNKYLLGCLSVVLSFLSSILSGYRIGIVVTALSLILACGYLLFSKQKTINVTRFAKTLTMGAGIIFAMGFVLTNYTTIVSVVAETMGMSSFAVFRITQRLEAILNLDLSAAQDTVRLEIWMRPFTSFWESLLPQGLTGTSGYVDIPILYFYDIFGSIATWVLLIWLLFTIIRKMFQRRKEKINADLYSLAVLMIPILMLLFIINGTFLTNVYQAIETSIIVGILCSKQKRLYVD